MTEPNFGIDGPRTELELERWAAGVAAKAERYQDMQRQVTAVTSTETSRDGVVTVTVDSAGAVTDLRITDQVRTMPGAQVAQLVLTTMRRAQSRITAQVAEIMQDTVGEDAQTVDAVVSNFRNRFPEPEPEQSGHNVVRDRRIGHDDEDDWGGDSPIMR
ncbi:DNA-binding protein YbaB [Kibdelosporangium banguiense]|uniref:DNA-binding protein YbaB n=1 Tax=Kibdelosporangium banguiense TaxID=1365924 RepID=A0ABS4TC06_9PSEU|nr:YbaB/EbfC family nucleoid-associated protein [Kibdelosporangium banguiense]MBP2321961.1 DNA-binding protein YbaB [Kibdelosporangium banguiense]